MKTIRHWLRRSERRRTAVIVVAGCIIGLVTQPPWWSWPILFVCLVAILAAAMIDGEERARR
jgi:hypothetical protein